MLLNRYQSRGLLFRVLALMLMLLILVMPIMMPMAEAVFFESAAVAYAYELIAAALVAGGFVVANSDDLISVSAAVYKWAKDKADPLCDTLLGIARQALSFAGDITSTAWRMSTQAWDAICDAINSLGFASGSIDLSGDAIDFGTLSYDDLVAAVSTISWSRGFNQLVYDGNMYQVVKYDVASDGSYKAGLSLAGVQPYYKVDCPSGSIPALSLSVGSDTGNKFVRVGLGYLVGDEYITVRSPVVSFERLKTFPVPLQIYYANTIPVSGTLTYPGTMTMAPPLPTTTADPDTGKEIVVVPPISVKPGDWTADIPKTDTGDLVDVPTDTLVDATTGERVDVDNPDIPINPDIPDWPSTGDLSIPALIVSKFPFCIPFDVARLIGVLQADPVAPVFKFPLKYGTILNEEIVLDLSGWSDVVQVIRWGELIAFVAGLIYVTRNYIKW